VRYILQKKNHRMAVRQHHPTWGACTVFMETGALLYPGPACGFRPRTAPAGRRITGFQHVSTACLAITADLRTAQWFIQQIHFRL
jgi:hypothetical protein